MPIPQLPQTPNVGPEIPNDLWKWLIELGNRIRALIDWANIPMKNVTWDSLAGKPAGFTPSRHASAHATGGSDPLMPADIGAAAVAQQVWQTPTLINGWVNYGPLVYNSAGYYKDTIGTVHLRGLIKDGTVGMTILVLPNGYRPLRQHLFAVEATGVHGRVDVYPAGAVVLISGNNGYVSFDGISFRAEA